MLPLRETDLYPPIKAFLEGQGYCVKGEVRDCDLVARRDAEPPVIVELKTAFSLALVFQGIRRQALSDQVYLAFARPGGKAGIAASRGQQRDTLKLCRRLGLGLITVRLDGRAVPSVEVHLDPAPYRPRRDTGRLGLLLREFQHRIGDPNEGGCSKRAIVTAYRQDALKCAALLASRGPAKTILVTRETGVTRAPRILQRDVYGWFQRVARGTYALTPRGARDLETYADVVAALE